jgi:arylsulfatase A-like enzyme
MPDLFALRGFQTREIQEEGSGASLDRLPYLRHLHEQGYRHLLEPNGIRGEMYYVPQPSQLPARDHPSQWIGDRSVRFISEQAGQEDPWYLFSSFIHPHPPFAPPNPWHKLYRPDRMALPNIPENWEALLTFVNRCQNRYKYRDNGYDRNLVRAIKAYYYACISFVDYQVGRILDALEQTGQLDRTLIVFTADHGEHLGDYRCFGKRSMHDSCARIPLILSLPGRFSGGLRCDEAASLVDLAPTLLAAADAEIRTHAADGVDLARLQRGAVRRPFVFAELSFPGNRFLDRDQTFETLIADQETRLAVFSTYMAANRDWKYFYSAPDNRAFLFDKQADPGETRNVLDNPFTQEARQTVHHALLDHLRQCGATRGLRDDDFIPFAVPPFVSDPDAGHLIQDYYTPWTDAAIPGYTD